MIGTRNLVCAWYFLKGNNEAITAMDTGRKDLVTAFLLSIALGVGLGLLIFVGGMIFTPSGFGKWSSQGLSIILGPVLQTSLFLLGLWLVLRLMQLADYFTQLAVATLWFGLLQYALLFPFTLTSYLLLLAGAAVGIPAASLILAIGMIVVGAYLLYRSYKLYTTLLSSHLGKARILFVLSLLPIFVSQFLG